MSDLLIPSFLMSDVSESLSLLTKNERPWAICSPKMSEWANHLFFQQIAHLLFFLQTTSNLLRKLMSEFPTMQKTKERIPNPETSIKNSNVCCQMVYELY